MSSKENIPLTPLLSVIIANYNNERYIEECLDSVLGQTYKNLEIIVSDDASDDGSPAVIRRYREEHPGIIKGIFSSVNRGVSATRHEALLQAQGEYMTTLDSDDFYYTAQKLEKEMAMVTRGKIEAGKDILPFSNIVLVKENGTVSRVWGTPNNIKEGSLFTGILSRTCMIPRDFVMKTAAYFEVGGYDVTLPMYEDWDLKLRLASRYEYYFSGVEGTAYRRHGKGLSTVSAPTHSHWLQKIFNRYIPLLEGAEQAEVREGFRQFMETVEKIK